MYAWFRRLFSAAPAAAPAPERSEAAAPPRPAARRFAADDVSRLQHHQLDFMFASWLFESEDQSELFTSRTEDTILAALDDVVKSEQAGAHMVRRMPGVVPQLLQSLRSSDFDGSELARKISHDLVLVAEVLRLANSAAYSPGKPIGSVDQAILVLGQDGLRQLITGVAFRPIVNLNSGAFTRKLAPRLWAQSERCAAACGMLVRGKTGDPFEAFLAGLVLNVGLTVSLRVIDKLSDPQQPVGSAEFCNGLASHGHALTLNICGEWHFPETVMRALREQESDAPPASLSRLGQVLLMGDYLSKMDILARNGRLDAADPAVTEGLSAQELDTLAALARIGDRDWETLAAPRAAEARS